MLPLIFLSSLSVISSTSWIMLWVFMELNTLALCSFMFKESHNQNSEPQNAMMYLTVQLISSIVLVNSVILSKSYPILSILTITSLFMKAGMWPTHMWYLKTLENMEMKTKAMKLMMTWQKVVPFMILIFMPLKTISFWMALLNLMIPLNLLKKSTNLKSTLILSSMNNNSWFFLAILSSITSFMNFFIMYSASIVVSLSFFKNLKTKMSLLQKKTWENMVILANMGSIPPTLMFLAKVMIVFSLVSIIESKEIIVLLMIMGCVFTYFYMWNAMTHMMNTPMKSQMMKKEMSIFPSMMIFLSIICMFLLLGFTFKDLLW